MKQTPKQKRPKTLNIHTTKYPIIAAILASNILLGCATAKLSNRTVSSVLEKENALIRKLKEQRLRPHSNTVLVGTTQSSFSP